MPRLQAECCRNWLIRRTCLRQGTTSRLEDENFLQLLAIAFTSLEGLGVHPSY